MLRITDFLKADMVARVARFLDREAIYEQVYSLYATPEGGGVSADVWQTTASNECWFSLGVSSGPGPRFRLSPNLLACLDFRRVLATPAFKAYMSAITGLPLGRFRPRSAHRMRVGDLIAPHSDRTGCNRLAFIVYLSPDWKADYGGELIMIGENNEFSKIEVTFNSLLLFDVTTQKSHCVTDIRSIAGETSPG